MLKILKEMTWIEFNQIRKTTDTVIIPNGAFEGYGPHMPLGSDIIVVEEIAARVAEKTGALIGPSIDIGESSPLRSFPGTMLASESNFLGYTRDICESLRGWGFKKFLFLTGHSGNVSMVNSICKEYRDNYSDMITAQVDWWRFAMANDGDALETSGLMAHGHAAECGTSVMLHLRPDLVDMKLAVKQAPREKYHANFTDIIQYYSMSDKTDSGTIGDATLATEEKGEKIVNACVERIVDYLKQNF